MAGEIMSAALGFAVSMFGYLAAYLSSRHPADARWIETAAGMLLIAGLALIGCALPEMV
jgi:uncharacterized membrane protein YgdD (TMEM256/DUF423 family)